MTAPTARMARDLTVSQRSSVFKRAINTKKASYITINVIDDSSAAVKMTL